MDTKMRIKKLLLFYVRLNWLGDQNGSLTSNKATETLHVGPPAEFGGEGGQWSPEHYFMSAVNGCFMTTFMVFVDKLDFEIENFTCQSSGEVELVDGRYKFTQIRLYPKVTIRQEEDREKVVRALEKTKKYCLISNSITAEVIYTPEIIFSGKNVEAAVSAH